MPTSTTTAPRLNEIGRDHGGAADGGHQNLGLAAHRSQVGRLGMANGDGGVLMQQQQRDGLTHDIAAAHHDGALTRDGDAAALQDLDDAGGRAGTGPRQACGEPADVARVESIDIFFGAMAIRMRFSSTCFGNGSCTRMPSISGRALS